MSTVYFTQNPEGDVWYVSKLLDAKPSDKPLLELLANYSFLVSQMGTLLRAMVPGRESAIQQKLQDLEKLRSMLEKHGHVIIYRKGGQKNVSAR
jgi:hypothetical protein